MDEFESEEADRERRGGRQEVARKPVQLCAERRFDGAHDLHGEEVGVLVDQQRGDRERHSDPQHPARAAQARQIGRDAQDEDGHHAGGTGKMRLK